MSYQVRDRHDPGLKLSQRLRLAAAFGEPTVVTPEDLLAVVRSVETIEQAAEAEAIRRANYEHRVAQLTAWENSVARGAVLALMVAGAVHYIGELFGLLP